MIDDIVIVAKGRDIWGNLCITYFEKDQPDLKRIKIIEKEDKNYEK